MKYGESLFWPEEKWRALQGRRLIEHLGHAGTSELYRGRGVHEWMREVERAGPDWMRVLPKLPVTTKEDMAAAARGAGRGACAVPPEWVAEWVCTSGTAGKPVDVPLTKKDLARLAENEAAALSMAGVAAGDLVVLGVGMDRMFVAGLAYWLGARELGATCVRAGPGAVQGPGLAELVGRCKGNGKVFVIAVPSFLVGAEMGETRIDGVIAIGEPVRGMGERAALNVLGEILREKIKCPIMSTYASTETCTTFAEGPECCGGHLNPELGILEVLDEEGRPVGEGEVGEIVVTPLGVEGMPLLRFRTGDMAAVYRGMCGCRRTTPRVGAIVGRRHQLLKFRGTSVYPAAIIETVRAAVGVEDCVVIAEREHDLSDRVAVCVVMNAVGSVEVEGRLRAMLRVTPEVRVVSREELAGLQGGGRKVARFVDRR